MNKYLYYYFNVKHRNYLNETQLIFYLIGVTYQLVTFTKIIKKMPIYRNVFTIEGNVGITNVTHKWGVNKSILMKILQTK